MRFADLRELLRGDAVVLGNDDCAKIVDIGGAVLELGPADYREEIQMAREFSPDPEGIDSRDGDANAERFREHFLAPALHRHDSPVVVFLDGLHYAPSAAFVKAAFGDLVTVEGFSKQDLRRRLAFSITDPTDSETRELARHFIEQAAGA